MTTTAKVFKNCIGGKWQSARSGQTFPNYNPATGELLGYFPLSSEVEANAAVTAAWWPSLRPTLFADVRPDMRLAQEEIFGPTLSVIEAGSFDEAIAVNNTTRYGLSSAIYTQDINCVQRAVRDITTGILYVNSGTTGAEIQFPYGGTRGTGNGHREAGIAGLDVFTEWKVVYTDYSGKLQKAQIDE